MSFAEQRQIDVDQLLQEVIGGTLDKEVAVRYLTIYLGEPSSGTWSEQIDKLYKKLKRKDQIKNVLAHAILVSTTDKSIDVEVPENFLHRSQFFRQLSEKDWFKDFQKVVEEDLAIDKYRAEAKSLGIIDPIEYQPYTRQAFNWLYDRAEDAGDITPQNKERVTRLLKNLVYAYGGAAICSVFTQHSEVLSKVTNWRTGYFFERVLFKVYTPEQVMKIKKQELAKTMPKLVKRIRTE